ncbi:IS1595 family transposase [Parasphingopyxis algicola]|uniref:IS1595 family transposase n=1 Tax=Parasphingopyxis algicola TaxID=2026624 RepID=UPI0015A3D6C2|nr:IS1595 family transposase [Parasphingopyxis algicola]QLC25098.1 IS1595 family transposase [Parasphingopyxis algicola]
MASFLSAPHFHDEEKAFEYVEERLWPEGPVCPHCGGTERIGKLKGKSTRIGLHKCYECRKPFTVKIGTIFESSHVKMHVWLQAMFLIAGSKKGISSNQLGRILGVTVKTAWFMSHRIREAMRENELAPFGSGGGIVEVDETFIGNDPDNPPKGPKVTIHNKMKVLALVDRTTGRSRAIVIDRLNASEIIPAVLGNMDREARLATDQAGYYRYAGKHFVEHRTVNHQRGEYVRGNVHTNTIEGYFSIFKRGMRGTYQHCQKKHLHRYLAEFDFRYSNREANGFSDTARADELLKGVVGKRLTYETANRGA